MYKARVEMWFAAAHRLTHYNGKCERPHGHNYKVRLTVAGAILGEGGMLVDFGELKRVLAAVLSRLDHSDLNEVPEFAQDPSAERIAAYICAAVQKENPALPVYAVDVFETETSMARYEPD